MTFSVTVVTLLGAPSYQWYFNNNAIASATSSSLTVTNVSVPNIGSYFAAVSDGLLGGGNSSTATLTVTDLPPTVNNDAYTAIENATLTVAAPGVLANDSPAFAGPLTAMLVTNVSHGTLNLHSDGYFTYLPAANYYGSDSFYYIASDGMSNSAPALVNLTISAPPTITAQPQSQQVLSNQTASFSVAASGSAPLSYQWWFQGATLAGATSSTLTVSNVQSQNTGGYSVVVTNSAGSTTSMVANLTILVPPTVSTLNASNVATKSATLNATVNPQGATASYYFSYGTSKNYGFASATNTLVASSSATTVATSITNLAPGTVYHYCVIATNAAGSSVGADMTFTTAYLPPKATSLTASNVTAQSATLEAKVNPEETTTTYYFRYGLTTNYGSFTATNTLAAGGSSVVVSMIVAGLAPTTVYHYQVVAVNSGGTSVSADTNFTTAYPPPAATTLNASGVTAGAATFNAAVNPQGTGVTYYFQYGLTTNYYSYTATNYLAAGTNTTALALPVAGLASGREYYYCVVAASSGGTTVATNASFTTLSIPPFKVTETMVNQGTSGRSMELNLSSVAGATFTVLSSSDLTQPLSNWTTLGGMTEVSSGQYQFYDPRAATNSCCFYSIRSN